MGAEARADVTSTSRRAWDGSLDPCGNFIPASSSLPDSRLDFVAPHPAAHLKALWIQMSAVLTNAN